MGLYEYDEAVLSNPNVVNYWDLNGNVLDRKGSNNMSGGTAGTYVAGPDIGKAMQFNGTTQSISTASTIDLTGTDKITIAFFWKPVVYDLTNAERLIELSAASESNAGSFQITTQGNVANDPLRMFVNGNVASNYSDFYPSTFVFGTADFTFICMTVDFAQAGAAEIKGYRNGILMTPSATSIGGNNTGAFGNYTLFLGGRNNSSFFHNGNFANVALFNTALSASAIMSLYQASIYSEIPSIPGINLPMNR